MKIIKKEEGRKRDRRKRKDKLLEGRNGVVSSCYHNQVPEMITLKDRWLILTHKFGGFDP